MENNLLIRSFAPLLFENMERFSPLSPTRTKTHPLLFYREIPGLWVLSARLFGLQRLLCGSEEKRHCQITEDNPDFCLEVQPY